MIELLIAVAVVGILAGMAGVAYIGTVRKAARAEAYANLQSIRLLEEQVFSENALYFPDPTPPRSHANPLIGASSIQAVMPGFQPGGNPAAVPDFGLNYSYSIRQNFQITNTIGNTVATPPTTASSLPNPCYVATASGIAGTRVENDLFAVDCNNNRNF